MEAVNIKNEIIYRQALTFNAAAEELKKTIINELTSKIEVEYDCEFGLGGDGVVVSYGDNHGYDDDYAKSIFMCDGAWFVEGEYDEYALADLDCFILLNIYECFEQTVEELKIKNLEDELEPQYHEMRKEYGENFIPLFRVNELYVVIGPDNVNIIREYGRNCNVPTLMDGFNLIAVHKSNLETLLSYLVKDKEKHVGIAEPKE